MTSSVIELQKFWSELKNKNGNIKFENIDKFERFVGNICQAMEDVTKSRDNWKAKYMEEKNRGRGK
jgi:hypothetical protein